jgi:MFS family permease
MTAILSRLPYPLFAGFAALAAFSAYFAMYGFRRPFTAGTYEGEWMATGVALKTAFVLSQLLGYTASKWIGVKVCSEATRHGRGPLLIAFILAAQLALVLFGWLPTPWKVVALFLNGLPLGMVWGLVVGYLEGRRCSDFVLAGLCGSFIIASAVVKDVGRWLMSAQGVPEVWMPAATGLVFLPVFALAVFALSRLPPPDAMDERLRVHRQPMDKAERRAFFRRFAPGLISLFAFYLLLTAFRDFRDNYGVEIFDGLGYGKERLGLFTKTELWVAIGSLAGLACINAIKDNRRALLAAFSLMIAGAAVLLGSTLLYQQHSISGLIWMIATGLGAYLAYVPINAVLFERLMAATGSVGTAVFGIQLADAIGYCGSASVQLYKDLGQRSLSHLAFFQWFCWILGFAGLVLLVFCAVYFHRRARPLPSAPHP